MKNIMRDFERQDWIDEEIKEKEEKVAVVVIESLSIIMLIILALCLLGG